MRRNSIRALVCLLSLSLVGQGTAAAGLEPATGGGTPVAPGQEVILETDAGTVTLMAPVDRATSIEVTAGEISVSGGDSADTGADPSPMTVVDTGLEVAAVDGAGRPVVAFPHALAVGRSEELTGAPASVTSFEPGVEVVFRVDGPLPGSVDPASVAVYHRAAGSDPWTPLPSAHDRSAGTVLAHADRVGQFAVMATPVDEAPVGAAAQAAVDGPTVVLDPDDDLGFAEWPGGRESELERNLQLIAAVDAELVSSCAANVVVTRGADRFVDRSIRAAVAANADPDLTVTLAFNALNGEPWGTEDDGGVLAWATAADDQAMAERFLEAIPVFTGRPSTQPVNGITDFSPYPELDAVVGPYAHIEVLYLDHNFDHPVITDQFGLVVDAAVAALTGQLTSMGFECDGAEPPDRPTPQTLKRLRDLGFQNYQIYGADPVSFSTGNLVMEEPIFTLPGLGDQVIDFTLTYNSQDDRDGVFGIGWSFEYNTDLQIFTDGSALVRMPDGHSLVFEPDGDGWVDPPGANATLTRLGSGLVELVLNTFDRRRFRVEPATGYGVLDSLRDRQGNEMRFRWGSAVGSGLRPLLSVVDEAGQRVDVGSDGQGRVTRLDHPDGRSWQLGYSGDRLASVTDARGLVRRFDYTGNGLLRQVVDGDGVAFVTNTYDGDGRVVAQANGVGDVRTMEYLDDRTIYTDALGNETTLVFNDLGQVIETIDAAGGRAATDFDDDYNPVSETDPNGNITRTEFDAGGRPVKRVDALGNESTSTYNEFGDLVRTEQPDGLGGRRTTTFEIDDKGRVTRTTFDDGSTATATFDEHGDRTSSTDANGNTTSYELDGRGNVVKITDPIGGVSSATFSLSNRLLTSTDANGNTTTYTYDLADNRVSMTDALGSVWRYEYNANNVLTKETDPLGRTTSYTYDDNLNLTAITYPDGSRERFTLDAEYGVVARIDRRGNTVETEYDALLRPSVVTDELGNRWTTHYDAAGNVVDVSDPLGNTTAFGYDALNRQVTMTDAVGGTWATTFDDAGNVTEATAADGTVIRSEYDSMGRVVARVDEEGHRTMTGYDPVGNVTSVTDRRGFVTATTYDRLNRVQQVTNPDGGITRRRYDPVGNLVAVTDPEGGTVHTTYDALDRPVGITDQLGVTSTTTYDAIGNPIANTDGAGHTWRLEYDAMDRLVAEVSPLGDREVTHYDANGNVTGRTTSDGVRTELIHDARNQLIEVVENARSGVPAGPDVNVRTRYERSSPGWLVASIDGNGHRTSYEHDGIGRVVRRLDPLGRSSTMAYDPVDNVVEQIDGNGNRSTMTYTPDRELASTTYADGSSVAFTHDADNFRVSMTDSLGTTTWERNWRGDEQYSRDAMGNVVEHEYDLNGNVTAIVYPDGFRSPRVFDAANRLSQVVDPSGAIVYDRDALGRPVVIASPNGVVTSIDYDAEGKTTSVVHRSPAAKDKKKEKDGGDGLGTILRYDYIYSVDDQILERTMTDEKDSETIGYRYDALDRLVWSDDNNDKYRRASSYEYDAVGNRVGYHSTDNPATKSKADPVTTTYQYDAADQLILEEQRFDDKGLEIQRTYDGNGSLILQASTELKKDDKRGKTEIETFTYNLADDLLSDGSMSWERDGLGRALTRTVKKKTTEMAYDGLFLIAQEGKEDGIYIRDDDQALRSQTLKSDKTETFLYDLLGTIHAVADKKGKPSKLAEFDDFGQLLAKSKLNSVFGFAGEFQDEETGRLHHYARSYDGLTGRFFQRDRIGGDLTTPITQHPYLYGSDDPINNADLLGYFGCCGVDISIPNPVDAVKSVGGKIVDGTKAAGEWAWEHKEAIAVSLVVGAAVACVLATAGICAGVGLAVAGGSTLAAATPFIVGGTSAVAYGITDRATDDDPNTRAFDLSDIGVDLAVGVGTAGFLRGGSAVVSAGVKRAATTRVGQAVAQSTVGRGTSTAVASATQLGTTVKSKVAQATAATANQVRSRAANSRVVLSAKNYIGRQSGRQAADSTIDDFGRLSSRATAFHDVLDPIARNSRTTSVMSTREGIDIIASGGRDLSPAQRALARNSDILGRLPGAHAEVTALDAAAKAGLSPRQMAVSRTICPNCQTAIEDSGGQVLPSGLGALWPR